MIFDTHAHYDDSDFDLVINSITEQVTVEGYNKRARDIIFVIIMKLITQYGMDELLTNKELISKKMNYGIFSLKKDYDAAEIEEILFIGDNYGRENIQYFKYLELLKNRLISLVDYCDEKQLVEVKEALNKLDYLLGAKTKRINVGILDIKSLFNFYEHLNKEIIISLLGGDFNDDERVVMVHFLQDSSLTSFDIEMNSQLESFARMSGVDMEQYYYSRENPFDFKSRIPLKSTYVAKGFRRIMCLPSTILSVTISRQQDLIPHLNRRVAIGFLPDGLTIDSILATNKNFNSEKDRYDFSKDSQSIAEILEYDKNNNRSNETLLDWTKVSPGYIYVYLNGDELDETSLAQAEEISKKTGLPIITYQKNNQKKS